MEVEIIDKPSALKAFLDGISDTPDQPYLYVDLEGNNLCRHGILSIVTIMIESTRTVQLLDVTTLGKDAFCTPSASNNTLKQILESDNVTKVFFDVRMDSDALYNLFGIVVGGI